MLISCRKLKKSFGDTVVLDGADLDICRGDRIGLVGRNGAGKSTLANILTGYLDYDEGSTITTRTPINIGYLKQVEYEPELYLNTLNSAEMASEFGRLASHLGIKRVQDWSGGRLKNLSGGEKTKLALARVWASQPDLVILDEPTNHLDYEGIKYLIAELAAFKGAAVIISHDRYFLDQTVSQIAEIENGTMRIYPGNYSWYRETKQKERSSQEHAYAAQQKEQKAIEDAITQLKTWSEKGHRESRQKGEGIGGKEYFRKKVKKRDQAVKSQIKRLEKMRKEEPKRPEAEMQVNFNWQAGDKRGRRLLEADGISKAYGNLQLFKDSSFYINRGEKVGILGPNGCGKTTLIKAILGQESIDRGEIFISPTARIAYVSQELPYGERETLQELVKSWPLNEQKHTFQLMVGLGIPFDRLNTAMGELSRGERMKMAMGLAIQGKYDLLLLDEPTNHLDLYSREALEESLRQFPGTIMLISHDRYFLKNLCDHMLIFDGQQIKRTEGNIEEYLSQPKAGKLSPPAPKANLEEELLLLETKMARVLGELSQYKTDHPAYIALDQEYLELIQYRNKLRSGQVHN